jgi:hypothetical protein
VRSARTARRAAEGFSGPRVAHYVHPVTLSLLAAVLSAAFATVVAARWRASRRPAFAAWTAGLLVFAAAAAVQAVGERRGFDDALFRAFYLLGGILGVAYLALGTVYLMAPRRRADAVAAVLGALTVVAAVAVVLAPVDDSQLGSAKGVVGDAFSGSSTVLVRGLAALLNAAGTLVLIGGSGWSAWKFWRDRAGIDRVVCNVLLTTGALVVAAGLTAARLRSDAAGGLSALGGYEAVGIAIMFAGFLSLGRVGRPAPAAGTTAPSAGAGSPLP